MALPAVSRIVATTDKAPGTVWVSMSVALLLVVVLPIVTLAASAVVLAAQSALFLICNLPRRVRKAALVTISSQTHRRPTVLSVQVPAYREPPEILIATLAALSAQHNPPPHEVIVIINNTPDRAVWEPVAAWCMKAGPVFRLIRKDGVCGAKAGALNIALSQTDPGVTHIVTVDADYQVAPDFLATVAAEIATHDADFIQFPQSYRHLTARSNGLSLELSEYFNRHARAANIAQAMLLTGTLSVIDRAALVAVGGWPTQSVTEDAELGICLIAAGYTGVFVDRTVGRGLMPLDLAGLHRQRHRWAMGNARVLASTLPYGLRDVSRTGPVGALRTALILSQLSAWLNTGALAALCLAVAMVQRSLPPWSESQNLTSLTIALSTLTLAVILTGTIVPLARQQHGQAGAMGRYYAICSRIAMLPVSALATVAGFLPTRQIFAVTPKQRSMQRQSFGSPHLAASSILALCIFAFAAAQGNAVALLAAVLLVLPLIGALVSQHAIAEYAATVSALEV